MRAWEIERVLGEDESWVRERERERERERGTECERILSNFLTGGEE